MLDDDACYRAVLARDARFDGWFFSGVTTTGVFCRPSCPARTPHRRNIEFHATAAAAVRAGFRACLRCRPDTTPGSPEWNLAGDVAARAVRAINDGVVDREGIPGLADRLGYSVRQLHRLLTTSLGAGPIELARAHRAATARTLLETTELAVTQVAFASGFRSTRQFNDTIRDVFACTPTALRHRRRRGAADRSTGSELTLRLALRPPYAAAPMFQFLAARAVAGVEAGDASRYARTMALPHAAGTLAVDAPAPEATWVTCRVRLDDFRDLPAAVERTRRLLDLDADPVAVDAALRRDPVLAPGVDRHPGIRVPGHVDGDEVAIRAVLGQQVSVAAATRLAGVLTERYGGTVTSDGPLCRLFPDAATIAKLDPVELPMPRAGAHARRALRGAGGWLRAPGRGCGPRRRRGVARRDQGHRTVDRVLRADAGLGRPRRVPSWRPRAPPRARAPRPPVERAGRHRGGAVLAAVPVLRDGAAVEL